MHSAEEHFAELERMSEKADEVARLRNKKVIDELRDLARNIEDGKMNVVAYSYSFRLKNENVDDDYDNDNESLQVEIERI